MTKITSAKNRGFGVFLRAVVAVLAGFIGIRGSRAAKGDSSLRPVHLAVAGLFAVACFVFLLLAIVGAVVGL
ncbi:MAG: DUF2970 domain-containing protein [Gammaproteobacteria bacterium]